MMKFGLALNAGLGALLVVSSLGMQKGDRQDLELSLDRAVHNLEELGGLRARIERGDKDAIAEVSQRSPEPGKDPRADDERLAQLRFEVSRLQTDWDALAASAAAKGTPIAHVSGSGSPTTVTPTKDPTTNLTSFEAPGFSVDPLRQGEALYHAGKYDDALGVLRGQPDDPRCQYWCARALEALGRTDEAIALYTSVSARKDASWAGERARTDLELLQWKKQQPQTDSKPAAKASPKPSDKPAADKPADKPSDKPAPKENQQP
jgi:hypothetical protein